MDIATLDMAVAVEQAPVAAKKSRFAPRARAKPAPKPARKRVAFAVEAPAADSKEASAEPSKAAPAAKKPRCTPKPRVRKPRAAKPAPTDIAAARAEIAAAPAAHAAPGDVAAEAAGDAAAGGGAGTGVGSAEDGGGAGEGGGRELALVPAADGAAEDDSPAPAGKRKHRRRALGRGPALPRTQQRALRPAAASLAGLDLGRVPLKQIVALASRKNHEAERARRSDLRRKAEEEQALGGDQRLALPAPRSNDSDAGAPAGGPAGGSLAPQVEVVDGHIRVVEASLTVTAQPVAEARVVVEDTQLLNSASYSNRLPNDRWNSEDTDQFYKAIQLFGTNWQLLERIFPGRPRRALKNKFRAEQRRDAARMDVALAGTPSSIEQYRQIIRILREAGSVDGDVAAGAEPASPSPAILLGIASPLEAPDASPEATNDAPDVANGTLDGPAGVAAPGAAAAGAAQPARARRRKATPLKA
ncbi:hypothetical protein WJX81_005983 [Elliptochloris bilobata]|uniref:Myb-like domain-containing protein n=1 Tax=Elliptochloris bilobata TaxID=381761 RepID=A0AAW1RX23_9CHLO